MTSKYLVIEYKESSFHAYEHDHIGCSYEKGMVSKYRSSDCPRELQKKLDRSNELLGRASELIKLSQTRLSTAPCENGKTLGENYTEFLKEYRKHSPSSEIACEGCGVSAEDYFEFGPPEQESPYDNDPVGIPWWCSRYCYDQDLGTIMQKDDDDE